MNERIPQPKRTNLFKALFAAGGVALGAGAIHEAGSKKEHQFPTEQGGQVQENGQTEENTQNNTQEGKEGVSINEHAKALVDFEREREGQYTNVDRAVLAELQENALREYLRFHPKVESRIKERYGSAPLAADWSRVVYVIASDPGAVHLGVYTDKKLTQHLFDLGIKTTEGEYEYVLRSPTPELGLAEKE